MSLEIDLVAGQRRDTAQSFEKSWNAIKGKVNKLTRAKEAGTQSLLEICKKDPVISELNELEMSIRKQAMRAKEFIPAEISHSDVLTNLLVQYDNDEFIGEQLMPVLNTGNQLFGNYWNMSKEDRTAYPDDTVGQGGRVQPTELKQSRSESSYALKIHSFLEYIEWHTIQNQVSVLDELLEISKNTRYGIEFRKEKALAAVVFGASNYNSTNKVTVAASDRWNSSGGGDPMGLIDDAKATIWSGAGAGELVLVLGRSAYKALKFHSQLLNRVIGGATMDKASMLNQRAIAELLEVDRVVVGMARENTATDASPTYARMWTTTSAALVRVAKTASRHNASFGYNFTAYSPKQDLFWSQEEGAAGVYKARSTACYAPVVVAPDTSYHFTTVAD